MKCPDCGSSLTELPVEGGLMHRCFKCGGFWADSFVLNSMTSKQLETWRRISISSSWLSQGKGVCPADGMILSPYKGENIPPSLDVKRCVRCGKWWFPGESLFAYKPAIETKVSYFRLWGLASDTKVLLLPALLLVVIVMGTVFGIGMVQRNQQLAAQAGSGVRDVNITYAGSGKAVVVFKADGPVSYILYKDSLSVVWKQAKAENVNGVFVVQLTQLAQGDTYKVMIGDGEYELKTD